MKLSESQESPELSVSYSQDENAPKKRGRRKGIRKKASEYDTKNKKLKDDSSENKTLEEASTRHPHNHHHPHQNVRFTSPAIDIPHPPAAPTPAVKLGNMMNNSAKTLSSVSKSCNELISECTALMAESHPVSLSSDGGDCTSALIFSPVPSPLSFQIDDFAQFSHYDAAAVASILKDTTVEGKPKMEDSITEKAAATETPQAASPVLGHPVNLSETCVPYNLQMELDFYSSFHSVVRQCYVEKRRRPHFIKPLQREFILERLEDWFERSSDDNDDDDDDSLLFSSEEDEADRSEDRSSLSDDDERPSNDEFIFDIGSLQEALKSVMPPSDMHSLQRAWMQGCERTDTELHMSI